MKPKASVIGPVVAMFLVGACAENAKPPTTAQQSADQAEQAAQKAQKEAQEARKDERTAQQKREDAERTLRRKEAEEHEAEQRAQQASYRAGHAEHRVASELPRGGAAEAQAGTMGHPGASGQTNPPAPARTGKVIVVTAGLLFPTNSAELAPAAKPKLDELAAALRAKPEANDVIAKGYTDDTGRAVFNKALSERRAEAVKDYLSSQGVPRDRIKTTGLGDASPASTNKTVEGRAVNRRVEVVVQPASGQPGQ